MIDKVYKEVLVTCASVLQQLKSMFDQGVELTLLIRYTGGEAGEGDTVLSSDDLGAVAESIKWLHENGKHYKQEELDPCEGCEEQECKKRTIN